MKFEEMIKNLEDIVAKMEDTKTPLEEIFDLYKKGVKLYSNCNKRLSEIESEVKIITENDGLINIDTFKGE